jgi:hypothetical protein
LENPVEMREIVETRQRGDSRYRQISFLKKLDGLLDAESLSEADEGELEGFVEEAAEIGGREMNLPCDVSQAHIFSKMTLQVIQGAQHVRTLVLDLTPLTMEAIQRGGR